MTKSKKARQYNFWATVLDEVTQAGRLGPHVITIVRNLNSSRMEAEVLNHSRQIARFVLRLFPSLYECCGLASFPVLPPPSKREGRLIEEAIAFIGPDFARATILGINDRWLKSFNDAADDALHVAAERYAKRLDRTGHVFDVAEARNKRSLRELRTKRTAEHRRFLQRLISPSEEPLWDAVKERRDILSPIARKAKKMYTIFKGDDDWQTIIKQQFPQFQEDLIRNLGQRGHNYSEPANMALEQAARDCGANPCQFNLSLMKSRLRDLRNS